MAKQIMTSERPGDNGLRQSIGNYKGVMLCNRPNDPAERPQRDGPAPFISRVTVKEQLGINPAAKLQVKMSKPKRNLEILKRHKLWLQQLQKQKELDIQKDQEAQKLQDEKVKKLKKKIKTSKKPNPEEAAKTSADPPDSKPTKLTEKNLKSLEKAEKPKWALTKTQAEVQEAKEEDKEVDNLLAFVDTLDYDEFINDLEVRQALEIVKERVEEIKRDKEWKKQIAEKYNNEDEKSNASKHSIQSFASKAKSQLDKPTDDLKKKEAEWDNSSRADRVSANDDERIAKLIADQVLANYPNLKAVHSNASVRRMLEQEAKNQLTGPVITTVKYEKQAVDPSNLPYLHRNPAV